METEQLKKLQKILRMIFHDFDTVCRELGIEYFICGGGAIGVVRHGGMIPWDDDIDVGMSAKDYEKFLKSTEFEMNGKYSIDSFESGSKSISPRCAKLELNGTIFIQENMKEFDDKSKIFLDVFCFDNVSDNDREMRKISDRTFVLARLFWLSFISKPAIYVYGIKGILLQNILKIAHYVLKMFRFTPKFFGEKIETLSKKYNHIETKRMAYMSENIGAKNVLLDKKDIYPVKRAKFDDIEINIPNNIEAYLEKRYKDYMTIPPLEQRHTHPAYILDFGVYGNE
jgi:lipopolysaccharide cholinephosphotransferase